MFYRSFYQLHLPKEKKGILSLDTENDPVLKNYPLQMFQEGI